MILPIIGVFVVLCVGGIIGLCLGYAVGVANASVTSAAIIHPSRPSKGSATIVDTSDPLSVDFGEEEDKKMKSNVS